MFGRNEFQQRIFRGENLEILRFREQHLQKCIKAAVEEKANLRIGEAQKNIRMVVAVVGYTNAGKSSLIKRLSLMFLIF